MLNISLYKLKKNQIIKKFLYIFPITNIKTHKHHKKLHFYENFLFHFGFGLIVLGDCDGEFCSFVWTAFDPNIAIM